MNMKITQLVVGPVGTNCYIAVNENNNTAFVVDPGDEGDRLIAKMTELSVVPEAILLTHGHFDHAGAAAQLAEHYDIPVIAYEKEQETLESPDLNLSYKMGRKTASYHADRYVVHDETIHAAGFSIRVLFTPGHTPGGCCFYVGTEDVLFSGDTLFCASVGRTDFVGGSMAALVKGIKDHLLSLPEHTLVLPGHGARTTIEQERIYNPFIV